MKPYQRYFFKLITDGKTKKLKILPFRTEPSTKHKHLIEFIADKNIHGEIKKLSCDVVSNTRAYRPDLIIIDDIEAPHRNKAIDMFSNIGYKLS